MHPQTRKQIVEGVMVVPQERLPEEIEEQIEDVLVPQCLLYCAFSSDIRCTSACRDPCRDRFALSTNASDRTRDARDDSSTCRRNTCSSDRICDACTHDRVELFLRFLFISCQMLAMTLLVW